MESRAAQKRRFSSVLILVLALVSIGSPALAAEAPASPDDSLEDQIGSGGAQPLVYGGSDTANPGWIAAITIRDGADLFYTCAGSLIHPEWVLTAAHCVDTIDTTYRVSVGSHLWYAGHERSIVSHHIHPGYDPADVTSVDLALLRLDSAVPTAGLPELASSPSWPTLGQPLVVTGWGETSTNSGASDVLQAAGVVARSDSSGPVPGDPFCPAGWLGPDYDDFCFSAASAWACSGDSGGPLVGRSSPSTTSGEVRTIYGISAYRDTFGCSVAVYDSVAQKVGPHLGWIRSFVPQPASPGPGDEMFFYRSDGLFRYYDVRNNGSLGQPIRSGDGYTSGWDTIIGIDLDGDGHDEMFFYREDGLYRFYDVRPTGSLPTPMRAGDGYTRDWTAITAIDLDGDGQDEMFFYREDGLYRFYDVRPSGALGSPILAGDGYTKGWDAITAVDIDGDGQDEMFFYREDGLFRYYDIRPSGRLPSPMLAGAGYTQNWSSITAVDLQGDGQDEMFFYRSDGLYRFYPVKPNATLGGAIAAGSGYTKNWSAITAVDLG